jgi:hypothetical protein
MQEFGIIGRVRKEGSSSFLKKGGARPAETKKLLFPEFSRVRKQYLKNQKFYCFFFSKKKCLPSLACLSPKTAPACYPAAFRKGQPKP